MRIGLLAALAGAAAAALLAWLAYDFHAAWLTFVLLAPAGCATVLVSGWVLRRRTGLRRQAALIGAVAAAQALATIGLFIALMFVSSHDAFFTVLATAYCAGLALWAGGLLSRRVLGDVRAIGASLTAVGEGRRDVQLAVDGDDEVARLARQVEVMVDRLARTEAARNDLVAAVSHDLRTPITSLRLLVEALDDDILDEADRTAYLAKLRTHVGALGGLIDDLFELSRLQAGDLRWSMERVRLSDLVQETVEAMRRENVARLVVDVPGDLVPARAAPEQIQRVLFNLIQNAIRHTPADGSVTVRAAIAGDGVQVEVADTGSGIADDDRERIFDAFFQGGEGAARTQRQRRPRPGDLARHRRGPRRPDLARAVAGRHIRAVHTPGGVSGASPDRAQHDEGHAAQRADAHRRPDAVAAEHQNRGHARTAGRDRANSDATANAGRRGQPRPASRRPEEPTQRALRHDHARFRIASQRPPTQTTSSTGRPARAASGSIPSTPTRAHRNHSLTSPWASIRTRVHTVGEPGGSGFDERDTLRREQLARASQQRAGGTADAHVAVQQQGRGPAAGPRDVPEHVAWDRRGATPAGEADGDR